MKIAILTTETIHHAYFVREMLLRFKDVIVLVETKSYVPSFPVHHEYELERDTFEINLWFKGIKKEIKDFVPVIETYSMNDPFFITQLRDISPDIGIVFGTGLLKTPIIECFRGNLYNLHGGNPEEYRGLDSHLWAIYHNDFDNLVTTIHEVNPILDDGHLVFKTKLPLHRNMKLSELRAVNTKICVELATNTLKMFEKDGKVVKYPQKKIGRYYSFMPSVLKEICIRKFSKYTSLL